MQGGENRPRAVTAVPVGMGSAARLQPGANAERGSVVRKSRPAGNARVSGFIVFHGMECPYRFGTRVETVRGSSPYRQIANTERNRKELGAPLDAIFGARKRPPQPAAAPPTVPKTTRAPWTRQRAAERSSRRRFTATEDSVKSAILTRASPRGAIRRWWSGTWRTRTGALSFDSAKSSRMTHRPRRRCGMACPVLRRRSAHRGPGTAAGHRRRHRIAAITLLRRRERREQAEFGRTSRAAAGAGSGRAASAAKPYTEAEAGGTKSAVVRSSNGHTTSPAKQVAQDEDAHIEVAEHLCRAAVPAPERQRETDHACGQPKAMHGGGRAASPTKRPGRADEDGRGAAGPQFDAGKRGASRAPVRGHDRYTSSAAKRLAYAAGQGALGRSPALERHLAALNGFGALPGSRSRYIPVAVRRDVWRRDNGCCSSVDPHSGRRCGSRYRLEIDQGAGVEVGPADRAQDRGRRSGRTRAHGLVPRVARQPCTLILTWLSGCTRRMRRAQHVRRRGARPAGSPPARPPRRRPGVAESTPD